MGCDREPRAAIERALVFECTCEPRALGCALVVVLVSLALVGMRSSMLVSCV